VPRFVLDTQSSFSFAKQLLTEVNNRHCCEDLDERLYLLAHGSLLSRSPFNLFEDEENRTSGAIHGELWYVRLDHSQAAAVRNTVTLSKGRHRMRVKVLGQLEMIYRVAYRCVYARHGAPFRRNLTSGEPHRSTLTLRDHEIFLFCF
jgi:hypothetical protein